MESSMQDMEVEKKVYELGRLRSQRSMSMDDVDFVNATVEELLGVGAIVDDDHRGVGWSLKVGGSGVVWNGLLFRPRGLAFLYWVGMGMPDGSELVCVAEPKLLWNDMLDSNCEKSSQSVSN